MKLLFFTRKIDKNDPKVGFVSDWVEKLANEVGFLYVLVWQKSDAENLPKNVKLIELPKNKILRLWILKFKLLKYIPKVDGVFTHMMPMYAVFVGFFTKLFRKKLIHWYMHKSVDWRLKLSNWFVNGYISASEESFRLKTKKPVHIFGHGINIERFKTKSLSAEAQELLEAKVDKQFNILNVGRISPAKNIDILIKIAEQIQLNDPEFRDKYLFQIIGGPGLISQQKYYLDLIEEIKESRVLGINNVVDFIGPLPQEEIFKYYANCDLFINLSDTGSLDKVVLEAMASNRLVLTSNEAFKRIIPAELFCESKDIEYLIDKIKEIYFMPENKKKELQQQLRYEVITNHNLDNLIKKIVKLFK
ncbi:MAG: glycosyltransferase family 4 protein [Patescibacteria group bacterium]